MVGDGAPTEAMPGSSTEMVARAFCLYSPFTIAIQGIARQIHFWERQRMENRSILKRTFGTTAIMAGILAATIALAQMDNGPKTEKKYGIGLPRDHASQLFSDADYPVFPIFSRHRRGADEAR